MWNVMFVMLFIFAIVMLIFSVVYERNGYWNLLGAFISSITWLVLSLSQMQIEIPYQFYNETTNTTITGSHVFSSPISPYLTYFFFGLFVVTQLYVWAMVWDKKVTLKEK